MTNTLPAATPAATPPAASTGVILLSHGSRDPLWRAPLEAVQALIARTQPALPCCSAYLELTPPSLAEAAEQLIAQGVTQLRITPLFLGTGTHARKDIPQLVAELRSRHPEIHVEVQPSVGEDPRLTALLAQIATEHGTASG